MRPSVPLKSSKYFHPASSDVTTVARVWSFPLQCTPATLERLSSLLGPEEASRAARFEMDGLVRQFTVAHGVLRLILSSFTDQAPDSIQILTGAHGKPYLEGRRLHFSLAHTDDLAVAAVSQDGPVGVDVERIRNDFGLDEFAPSVVSEADRSRILALPRELRVRAWFQAWTVREALAKATGEGLGGNPAALQADVRTWELELGEAHVGACAATRTTEELVHVALPDLSLVLSHFSPT